MREEYKASIFAQDWDYNEEKDSVVQKKVAYINTKKVEVPGKVVIEIENVSKKYEN